MLLRSRAQTRATKLAVDAIKAGAIDYLAKPARETSVWELAVRELQGLLRKYPDGDALVFMPGAYEIMRTVRAARDALDPQFLIFPLHGELPPADQDAAREAIGAHVIGQDARVAFRHPAAVDLLRRRWHVLTLATYAGTLTVFLVTRLEALLFVGQLVVQRSRDIVLAAMDGLVEEGARAQIDHIRQTARRLTAMVDDLIADAMADAADISVHSAPLDLGEVLGLDGLDLGFDEGLDEAGQLFGACGGCKVHGLTMPQLLSDAQ